VVLDLSHIPPGAAISAGDVAAALESTGYELQPLDIVLIRTDAARYRAEPRYLTDHPGMSKAAVHWLLDRGIKVMGIDAIGFDVPVPLMFERRAFWEAHMVMLEREYYHLENLVNLDQIPISHGFTVSVLPIPYRGASAAPVRAVAILPAV
jgi:kynurenine formamidase